MMMSGGGTENAIFCVAFFVIISVGNCSMVGGHSNSSCRNASDSTLNIKCDGFNTTQVHVCFHQYEQTEILNFKNSGLISIPFEINILKRLRNVDFSRNRLMRTAKVQASLRIRTVSPEPPLLAHTSSESRGTFRLKARSLAPLNGWVCAVKICHDGMLEDTNSLDGAQIMPVRYWETLMLTLTTSQCSRAAVWILSPIFVL